MIDRHEFPQGRRHPARRPPFVGAVAPLRRSLFCWEIRRESSGQEARFGVYLDGARIGRETGAVELRELLAGARLRRQDVRRVIEALGEKPVVWVEVRPEEPAGPRRPSGEPNS